MTEHPSCRGKFSGVQASFRNLTGSLCIYVHCHAHRVNLVLVDTCSIITAAGDLFGLLEAIHNFVTVSSIRHEKFVDIQKDRREKNMELPLLSDARWVCKLKAVTTFKNRYQSVVLTLLYVSAVRQATWESWSQGIAGSVNVNQHSVHVVFIWGTVAAYEQCKYVLPE